MTADEFVDGEVVLYGMCHYNLNIAKASVIVSSANVTVVYGETAIVRVSVDDVRATGTVTVHINGEEFNATLDNGNATVTLIGSDAWNSGGYTFYVTYSGDGNFTNATSINYVLKINIVNVTASDIIVGENATINVTLNQDATGNVTIFVHGFRTEINQTEELNNGSCIFIVPGLEFGKYIIGITYTGDYYYNPYNNSEICTFKVKDPVPGDKYSSVSVEDASCKLNSPVDLVAHVVGDSGYVTFYVNDIELNSVKLVDAVIDENSVNFWLQKVNPLWSVNQALGKIIHKETVAKDTVSLTIQFNRKFNVGKAGQHHPVFVVIDGIRYERTYSLTQLSDQKALLTAKKVEQGKVSSWLVDQSKVGDILEFGQPYGDMLIPEQKTVILLAAGSGITPMYSLISAMVKSGEIQHTQVQLLYCLSGYFLAVRKP